METQMKTTLIFIGVIIIISIFSWIYTTIKDKYTNKKGNKIKEWGTSNK